MNCCLTSSLLCLIFTMLYAANTTIIEATFVCSIKGLVPQDLLRKDSLLNTGSCYLVVELLCKVVERMRILYWLGLFAKKDFFYPYTATVSFLGWYLTQIDLRAI